MRGSKTDTAATEEIRLSLLDASFLAIERATAPTHMGALLMLDGRVEHAELLEMVAQRVPRLPALSHRLAMPSFSTSLPRLVPDPSFRLSYHIREQAVAAPYATQDYVEAAARAFAQPLRRYRPLWEQILLNGGHRSALLCKLHHCIADGMAGVRIMEELFAAPEPSPNRQRARERLDARKQARKKARADAEFDAAPPDSEGSGVLARLARIFEERSLLIGEAKNLFDAGVIAARNALNPPPVLPFNGSLSPLRRLSFFEMNSLQLNAIKRRFRCTTNDVVLAVIIGGLRVYLSSVGFNPQGLYFKALVPVSTRKAAGDSDSGNEVSGLTASLPLGIANPVRCLHEVAHTMRHLQSSGEARIMGRAVETMGKFPPLLLPMLAPFDYSRAVNVVCTNVPGPAGNLEICGHRVRTVVPLVPLVNGIGLAFGAMNYAGSLCIGINADALLVRDSRPLTWGLKQTYGALGRAATAGQHVEEREAASAR